MKQVIVPIPDDFPLEQIEEAIAKYPNLAYHALLLISTANLEGYDTVLGLAKWLNMFAAIKREGLKKSS